ncbi:MAG: FAD-dependent oxidoreductase, partial [Candidatus Bipolaricaulia bacterium]
FQEHRVVEIKGEEFVTGLVIESLPTGERQEFAVEGVFVEIGLVPNTDFLRGFIALNERGEVVIDRDCQTSVPGVFAAGDVVEGLDKQIVISAGQGARAALSAYRYLIESGRLSARGVSSTTPWAGEREGVELPAQEPDSGGAVIEEELTTPPGESPKDRLIKEGG